MKKIISVALVMLFLTALFSGCGGPEEGYERLPNLIFTLDGIDDETECNPSWFQVPKTGEKNEGIDIHLILDAGMGMKGFAANRDSNYLRIVSALDSVCANIYDNYSFSSYKMLNYIYLLKDEKNDWQPYGTEYTEIIDENYFYGASTGVNLTEWSNKNNGQYNVRNTEYKKIIEKIEEIDESLFSVQRTNKSNSVFIIVSDFLPDKKEDSTFCDFTNELYAKVLSNGVGCGIIGIQSSFNGEIHGIQKENKTLEIDYKGDMPFYFMVIGEIEEVNKIINQIQIKAQQYKVPKDDINTILVDTRYPYDSGKNSVFANTWQNKEQLASFSLDDVKNKKLVSLELIEENYIKNMKAYNFKKEKQKQEKENVLYGTAFCNLDICTYARSNLKIEDWGISCNAKVIQGEKRYPYKNLLVFKEDDPDAYVPQDISMEKYEYVYSQAIDKTKKMSSIDEKNEIWIERTYKYDGDKKAVIPENAEEIVKINNLYVKENTLYIDYAIYPEKMLGDMPYIVEMRVNAAPDICLSEMDEWAENWTMDLECFVDWDEESSEFMGGCTPYFVQAIEGLRGENIEEESFLRTYSFLISKSQLLSADE